MENLIIQVTEHSWRTPMGEDKPQSYHARRCIDKAVAAYNATGGPKGVRLLVIMPPDRSMTWRIVPEPADSVKDIEIPLIRE